MSTATAKKPETKQDALDKARECYDKWKAQRNYIAHLNSAECRGQDAWSAIQKLAKEMGW